VNLPARGVHGFRRSTCRPSRLSCPPLLERFKPDVIVAQLGIDAHRTDPLTQLCTRHAGLRESLHRAWYPSRPRSSRSAVGLRRAQRGQGLDIAWAILNGVELAAELPTRSRPTSRTHGSSPASSGTPPR
jgi:hypothetical protein